MSKRHNADFYNINIAPKLRAIAERCRSRKISFIAIVEFDSETMQRGVTETMQPEASDAMQMLFAANKAAGNIDQHVITLARIVCANQIPHNSVILQQIGVHSDPAQRKDLPADFTKIKLTDSVQQKNETDTDPTIQ